MPKEYRLEDDLLKKQVPRRGSKRYLRLHKILESPAAVKCEICGKHLFNPQSILIHQGGGCRNKNKTNEQNIN